MIFGKKCTYQTVLIAVSPEFPNNASGIAQASGCSPDMVKRSLVEVEAESDVYVLLTTSHLQLISIYPVFSKQAYI